MSTFGTSTDSDNDIGLGINSSPSSDGEPLSKKFNCGEWVMEHLIELCFAFLIIIATGISISSLTIMENGNKYTDSNIACPIVDINNYTFTKQFWHQWKWLYDLDYDGHYYQIEQKCFSVLHDVNFKKDGQLVSRSDNKIFTLITTANINDCHGNTIYIVDTANYIQELINMNGIWVSACIKNPSGNIIGYIDSTKFFNEHIQITDYNTKRIAVTMDKNFFSFPWKWNIVILDPTSPVSDPRITTLLAGHLSFSNSQNGTTDMCNTYVRDAGITSLVFLILCVCFFCHVGAMHLTGRDLCCEKKRK